ncbi:ubiquinol-cytochrome c reductase complex assembly factor 5-like [Cololabis saira]|uniref:ubiquinol-cytochrome c reductase complex assembly factor 5-like n=1 Tax=Cololabis saira TaxID=129043 RepID=UPI002AD3C0E1|nr:ubiquinol-cytochrome c reductase complex assembly factor 5-like [Cololabis saira]
MSLDFSISHTCITTQVIIAGDTQARFGSYRFLPIFFCIGGVMEWIMINVRIGRETFYDVYRRKRAEREYQQKIVDGQIVLDQPAAK